MHWEPITDLPQDWKKYASSELPPLVMVWNEQAERLRDRKFESPHRTTL